MGLRQFSLPFDWLITENFSVVLDLIDNQFKDFLKYENMFQEYDKSPAWYMNLPLGIHFYHDFSAEYSLAFQMNKVREKYQRRIARFYEKIKEPTLFVRYCYSAEEVSWIDDNYDEISLRLKRYNEQNDIIFIINAPLAMKNEIKFFVVEKDFGDTVARRFFEKAPQIYDCVTQNYTPSNVQRNLKRVARKNGVSKKIKNLFKKFKRKLFNKRSVYRHDKTI